MGHHTPQPQRAKGVVEHGARCLRREPSPPVVVPEFVEPLDLRCAEPLLLPDVELQPAVADQLPGWLQCDRQAAEAVPAIFQDALFQLLSPLLNRALIARIEAPDLGVDI